MNAEAISPEEQIRRVARVLLSMPRQAAPRGPKPERPELRGLIEMLERHLDGDLPPLRVAREHPRHD